MLCRFYQLVYVSICSLSLSVGLVDANLAEGMVCIGEASIGYYFGQHTLQGNFFSLFSFGLCIIGSIFIPTFATLLLFSIVVCFWPCLAFVAILSSRCALILIFSLILIWLDKLLYLISVRVNRVNCQISCMSEGILLVHRNSGIFFKLMRSEQTQYSVRVVSQDHITRCIQLDQDMVRSLTAAKSQIHYAIDT